MRTFDELMSNGVSGPVDGTETAPIPSITVTTTTGESVSAVPTSTSSSSMSVSASYRDSFAYRNQKAIAIIRSRLSDGLALKYGSVTSAKALWDSLIDEFEKSNVTGSAFLEVRKVIQSKLDTSTPPTLTSVSTHMDELVRALDTLNTLGFGFNQKLHPLFLLASLPDTGDWRTLRTAIMASTSADNFTFAYVREKVLSHLSESTQDPVSQNGDSANFTSGKSTSGKWCKFHNSASHSDAECRANKDNRGKRKKGGKDKRKSRDKRDEDAHETDGNTSDSSASTVTTRTDSQANFTAHVVTSENSYKRIVAYISRDDQRKTMTPKIIDSGATCSMSPDIGDFETKSYKKLDPPIRVRFGNNTYAEAIGRGTLRLSSSVGKSNVDISIHGALHIPSFHITLISVHQLAKRGLKTVFDGDNCTVRVKKTGDKVLAATHQRGLYHLNAVPIGADPHALHAIEINRLHRILGHTNFQSIQNMVRRNQIEGVTTLTGMPQFCEACVLGKMKRLPFPSSTTVPRGPLDIVSCDVGGPVTPQGAGGIRYWVVFVDHYSSYVWVKFVKTKDEVHTTIKQWRTDSEAQLHGRIAHWELCEGWTRFFRTDNGGEFTSAEVEAEFRKLGIIHETTAPRTPEQNGVAERMNGTLVTRSITNLVASHLPRSWWPRAMEAAAYTINRSPAAGQKGKTPYERLYDRRIDIHHLHTFGCPAYPLVEKELRSGKFTNHARRCVFIGYVENSKAYWLLDLETQQVIKSRHVAFNDDAMAPKTVRDTAEKHTAQDVEQMAQDLYPRTAPYFDLSDDDSDSVGAGGDIPHEAQPEPILSEPIPTTPEPSMPTASRIPRLSTPSSPVQRTPPATPTESTSTPTSHAPARRVGNARVAPAPTEPRRSSRTSKPAEHRNAIYERAAAAPQQSRSLRKAELEESRRQRREEQQERILEREIELLRREENSGGPDKPEENTEAAAADNSAAYTWLNEEDYDTFSGLASNGSDDPSTWDEAMSGSEAEQWQDGLNKELSSFEANDVYEVVPIPSGVKPITSKLVLKRKLNADGEVERHKVRMVARGFTQREGHDYQPDEIFTPVANLESVRIMCALAAKHDLELEQMDVSTAYLNGELTEEVYLMPPSCVYVPKGHCWRLKRSLYGLKQAGRVWNKTLDKKLRELGFERLNAETCLYVLKDGKNICFLVVYVDDLLLAGTTKSFTSTVKQQLSSAYRMRDLGPARFILGIEIQRNRRKRTISLSQRQYFDNVLARYGMTDCNPVKTPMATNQHISSTDPDNDTVLTHMTVSSSGPVVSYQSIVGSLMYAMLGTRPDLAYTVGLVGRYSASPKRHHWELLKRALRYLKGTRDWVLQYDGSDGGMDLDFHGYSDADWSGDPDTSRSTSGFVFISTGGAIGWSSKRQTMVALSSTESEYIGLANAGQHLAWLRSFFEEIGQPQSDATELRCDNRAAIILSKDPQFRARTKHIQRKYHYIRDGLVATGECAVVWYPTDEMVADIFTKALPHDKHVKFSRAMGLRPGSSGGVRNGMLSEHSP
jgi:transposase InsO family protein